MIYEFNNKAKSLVFLLEKIEAVSYDEENKKLELFLKSGNHTYFDFEDIEDGKSCYNYLKDYLIETEY